MSTKDDDVGVDELAALAKQIDLPAPAEPRVELMRASLLRAAAEDRRAPRARWPLVAGGFSAGALAAAATATVVLHHPASVEQPRAQIEASTAADFDRTITHEASGTDEAVRLHAGRISLAVAELPKGDHVRVVVRNGEIEGVGLYEVTVVDDAIKEVTVKRGSAHVRLVGQQDVFLAVGQVWRSPIATADLDPAPPGEVTRNGVTTHAPSIANATGDTNGTGTTPVAPIVRAPSIATVHAPPTHAPTMATEHDAGHVETPTAPSHVPTPIVRAPSLATDDAGHVETPLAPIVRAPSIGAVHDDAGQPSTTAHSDAPPTVPALHTMADVSPGEAPPNAISQIAKAEKKPVTALERHFSTGWSLLRAGKPAEAARELAAAADAGGDDPLAGDARYFEAIALTQAGRKTEAEHALVAFMDRSPHAVRRGRAAVMLGRLIAERGDKPTARTWFESATHDPDPNVVAAANAELAVK